MKVLFIAGEALPFASTGGLGEVMASLPAALRKRVVGARVVMPLYSSISGETRKSFRFVCSISVPLGWRQQHCGVFETKRNGVTYYFLDNEYYFKRNSCYGEYDDAERFAYFSKAVLEMLGHLDWKPDILHCNDWHTALVPVFYHAFYRELDKYKGIRTVFTIHNIQYQGQYDHYLLKDMLGLDEKYRGVLDCRGLLNFMKGAVEVSDAVTTVSPTYASEILNGINAYGMEDVLRYHAGKIRGILNGIDTVSYDPQTDPSLFEVYSREDPTAKALNKSGLQKMLGLPVDPGPAMLSMVTRLSGQKGIDLLIQVFDLLMQEDVQLVILGTGERRYEVFMEEMQRKYPMKFVAAITFNHDLARKIYAASDLFLMPSLAEPCGLSQMIALRYGTLPVVRETGGLKDTVFSYNESSQTGNGFSFAEYNAQDMLYTLRRGL
ncbi:MAG TPA: starch synthase, partial [Clostridiales bacterium]|nr:starch synthase [Clostridiales bacterium]